MIREAFRPESYLVLLAASLALAAAIAVPKAGVWLGLAILTAAGWRYQTLVREGGDPGTTEARFFPGAGPAAIRVALGIIATLALVTPFIVRNGGRALPAPLKAPGPGTGPLALLATLGWLLAPLLLAVFNGRDRAGAVGLGRSAIALARHPFATVGALLALPLTFLALEPLIATFVWWQGQLPLLVTDLFPPPRLDSRVNGAHMVYIYDGLVIERIFSEDPSEILPVYLSGLRRGFSLVGTIPSSLLPRSEVIVYPEWFHTSAVVYVLFRGVVTVLIFSILGSVLCAQARMLGFLISVGTGRAGNVGVDASAATAPAPVPPSSAGTGLIPVGGTSFGTGPIPYPTGQPAYGSGPIPAPSARQGSGLYPLPNVANGGYPGSGTYPIPAQALGAPGHYAPPAPLPAAGTGSFPVPASGPPPTSGFGTGSYPVPAAAPPARPSYGTGVYPIPTHPAPGSFAGPAPALGPPANPVSNHGTGMFRLPTPAHGPASSSAPLNAYPAAKPGLDPYRNPASDPGARSGLYAAPPQPAPPSHYTPAPSGYGSGAYANPLAAVHASHPPAPGAPGNPSLPRILIVDDERAFAEALARVLSTRGFSVTIASDAGEGLRLALATRPDLVVLDWMLPDRPGCDVCREIRASPDIRQTPILMTTYRSASEDEVAALASGADDYLVKPYVIDVLIARIQNQLRKRLA